MNKDMTKGNPSKILFYFALPMFFGNMLQQLYNIVDSVIVGNYLGADSLAAVGASYPITFFLITIANGAGIGCGVVIAQYFGGKRIKEVKISIYTALIFTLIFSGILFFLGIIFTDEILNLMNTPENIFSDSSDYMRIYFWGVVFMFIYNIGSSSFNALGNSKIPLEFLIVSTFFNVVLDVVFIVKFNLGVKGAAYATFISQAFSSILCICFLFKSLKELKSEPIEKIFDVNILKKISKIAVPSILQQSIVSVGNLFVQALVNSFGSIVIAGYAAAAKIDSIIILPMANMSNAVSTFTSQNIGGRKVERVSKGYKSGLIMIGIFCVLVGILIFLFGHQIVGVFVDSSFNSDVICVGTEYLRTVSSFYFFMGLMVTTNGVLRGSGDMKYFLASTISNLSTRVCFAYILAFIIGQSAIWWAVPLGWLCASIISVMRYKSGKWKNQCI